MLLYIKLAIKLKQDFKLFSALMTVREDLRENQCHCNLLKVFEYYAAMSAGICHTAVESESDVPCR